MLIAWAQNLDIYKNHRFLGINLFLLENGMTNTLENKTLFGTDGIRATVGMEPFTNESFRALSNALADWIVTTYGPHAHVLICHDSRQSAQLLMMNFVGQCLQYPIAFHDAGMLPTPAAHSLIKKNNFHCSIVFSASHNPYQDNGIKIIDAQTGKINSSAEQLISELYSHYMGQELAVSFKPRGTYNRYTQAELDYIQLVREKIEITSQPIVQKVIIDAGNGACSSLAALVFNAFGIEAIHVNNRPTGTNINEQCGATHPQSMIDTVITEGAFLGFSFDGDGDRIVMADATGLLYTGDEILSILSQHPRYRDETLIVGTLMSNIGFEHWLIQQGKQLLRTQVGDKHVIARMAEHNALLGGEPSGHIIMKDHLASSDAIFTALFLTLFLATSDIAIGYQRFPQKIRNIKTKHPLDTTHSAIKTIVDTAHDMLETGRIIVRNSGTEQCVRIMVEAASLEKLETAMAYLSHEIKKCIEKEL